MFQNHEELKGMKILIVDDTLENLNVLRSILSSKGFNIYIATNGELALKLSEKTIPDLILLDVMMPGMNGFETCQKLKANSATKDIPVIFVSAKSETSDIVDGFSVGGVDYIVKPFNMEEVIVRVHTQLKLKKTTEDLKLAVVQLHAAQNDSLAKSEFLTRMSHELKTPLNAIIGFSALMQNNQDNLTPKQNKNIKFISDAGNRLHSIIKDILDVCLLEPNAYKIFTAKVELNPLLENSICSIRELAETKGIRIGHDFDLKKSIFVTGDAQRIKQILDSLLINAVKYNKEQGKIDIGLISSENGKVVISVADTGEGIQSSDYDKIFEPLFRLEKHRSQVSGLGLGLTLSKKYIELMGGAIQVESKPGEGSCFKLQLQKFVN
ncbi:MAG: hybrid sensor histidine kinase/response regulator [Candidatus Nitrohelix vancouverensis]|uniref:histidine kinase n=1 Tax=Candidatus Nitrohelix vancouverensis TaxID=2705534 RepID=A0A7T0C463_9BACT|nr:MAG: hybrid sensor histidine kinase/response regulator [Candidatus Nitrohelix vancouverensis]